MDGVHGVWAAEGSGLGFVDSGSPVGQVVVLGCFIQHADQFLGQAGARWSEKSKSPAGVIAQEPPGPDSLHGLKPQQRGQDVFDEHLLGPGPIGELDIEVLPGVVGGLFQRSAPGSTVYRDGLG
nr:hypothetical protein [Catenulispora pinisilvae]